MTDSMDPLNSPEFMELFGAISDGFVTLNENYKCTFANNGARRFLREATDGFIDKSIWDLWPGDMTSFCRERFTRAYCEQVAVTFEELLSPFNTWVEVRIYPSQNGLSVMLLDATDRRNSQINLEVRYQSLFELNPDAICALDLTGKFLEVNPAILATTGFEQRELSSMTLYQLIVPDDLPQFQSRFLRAVNGEAQSFDCRIYHRTGEVIFGLMKQVPIVVQGVVIGVHTVIKDTTVREREHLLLRRSEERLAVSQRIAHVGSWELDTNTMVSTWTEEVFHIFGLRPSNDAVVVDMIYGMILLEDRDKVQDAISNIQNGIPLDVEYRIVRPNGDVRYVHSQQQVENTSSHSSTVCGMIQDITERKRVELKLEESQERYQSLKRYNPAGVVSLDLEGHFIGSNPAFEKLLGYTLHELKQLHAQDLVLSHRDWFRICHKAMPTVNGRVVDQFEGSLRHKDGHSVHVSLTFVPIIIREKMTGLYVIVQDISQRKRTERRLRESEQRYKSLLEYNGDGVCALDLSGNIIHANPAYLDLIGYSQEELTKMTYRDLLYDTSQRQADGAPITSLRVSMHWSLRTKDGGRIESIARTVPIIVDGEVVGIYLIVRDVTRQKQMEELLRKSEKLSAVGQLAAGVAHEIRNPLTALKGFLKVIESSVTVKPEYFRIMEDELSRIELIASELLVLGKPTMNVFRPRNLFDMIQTVVLLLETQSIIKNIEINMDCGRDLPLIDCDENQLKQVFINIIKNGIEAMGTGGRLTIQAEVNSPRELAIFFTDTGKGIPAELLSKLGEPFYTTKEKGTGLGLMVTHKIVENHGGTIEYRSTVGVGTTVVVRLPISRI